MKKIILKLIDEAFIEGHDGAFLIEVDSNGNYLSSGLCGEWYKAHATDDAGNDYTVYWNILDSYKDYDEIDRANRQDEACNWDNPYMVINENGENVVEKVVIEW